MIKIMRNGILGLVSLVSFVTVVSGQAISMVHTHAKEVLIGDTFALEVRLQVPENSNFKGVTFANFAQIVNEEFATDSINNEPTADVEILSYGAWASQSLDQLIPVDKMALHKEGGMIHVTNKIVIAIYNPGRYSLVGPQIVADSTTKIETPPPAMIIVKYPKSVIAQDSLDINPIKDIIEEPQNWQDYMWLGYVLAGLGLLYWLWQRRKNIKPGGPKATFTINPSAHDIALKQLLALREEKPWLSGDHKVFQTTLTDIMRTYLDGRYGIQAQKMTTQEIDRNMSQINATAAHRYQLQNILHIADLVKFAQAEPGVDIHAQFLDSAIDLVNHTKQV
jgi:hypothetical protein